VLFLALFGTQIVRCNLGKIVALKFFQACTIFSVAKLRFVLTETVEKSSNPLKFLPNMSKNPALSVFVLIISLSPS
jgi:hypothetical protein